MAQTNIPHLEIIQAAIERAVENGWPRLSVSLIDSVAQQESNRRHVDEDGKLIKSGAGAQGYLQIMPAVETDLKLDASDLTENIYAGVEHLAKMHKIAFDKYGLRDREAAEAALTMYNFGAAAYEQALKGDRVKPPEAVKYSGEVLARMGDGDAAAAATFEVPKGGVSPVFSGLAPLGEIDLGVAAEELGVKVATGGSGGRARKQAKQYADRYKLNQEEFDALSPEEKEEISAGQHVTRQRDMRTELTPYQADAEKRGHIAALLTDPNVRYGKRRSDPSVSTRPQVVPRPEIPLPFPKRDDPLAVPDTSTMPLDLQGMEPGAEAGGMQTQAEAEKPSFLSRIGGAIKNNPMVASQIAQVVGGIGSGILGGRRMAKEQAKSARRQREAMNMANAISTLTRGRTQPAVAPRPVISKPGGAETIFDILGTLGQGGAQITQGIQQREEAAEDRSRAQEMEDFQKDLATRGLDIEELKVKGEMREQQIAAQVERIKSIEPVGQEDFNPLDPGEGDFIKKTLNELKALHAEGGPGTTGYFSWDRKWLGPAKLQKTFDGKRNMLINNMRKVMGLGRLTKEDLALVLKTLPEVGDTSWELQGKIDGILGIVDRLEQRSAGVLGLGAGDFAGTGGDYSGMTNEELEKLLEADPGNEAVVAVMQDRLREDN